MKRLDLTGERFGSLVVLRLHSVVKYQPKWECVCDCGSASIAYTSNLKKGHTTSCGCKSSRNKLKTHGLSYSPLYQIYHTMIQRCYNKANKTYLLYGGRGVTVCDEWRNDFNSFYNWAVSNGWRKGLEIDKDIKGGMTYSPDNCLVVTKKRNIRSRRVTTIIEYNGVAKSLSDWCDQLGVSYDTMVGRIKKLKWPIEKAFNWEYRKRKTQT